MKTKRQILEKLREIREKNEMNKNRDVGWDANLTAVELRAKIKILRWVLDLDD